VHSSISLIEQVPSRWRGRPIHFVLASTILLGACTQIKQITGTENCTDPSLSPSQQELCKDDAAYNRTIAGGALLGGAVGAAGGALTCAITGKANPLVCGAVGLGIGLFAGGVTGYVVAKQQQATTDKRRAIEGVTDDVRKQNEALRTEVNAARTVAAEDQKKLARINAATRSGEMTAEQAQSERARIADDSKHLETIIQHLETQQGNYQSAGQQLNQTSADYTRQLADMKGQIDIMKRQKETLDRAISASG
jgi:hypothetical protein